MKNIEDVRVGDLVLSKDQYDENGALVLRPVSRVFRRTSDHLRVLDIEGDSGNVETIRTTDEHPFWADGRGWTLAGDLRPGERVQESDGTWQRVLASERFERPDGVAVYNFEVEGEHTYFVDDGRGAADAVWVHNLCIANKFITRIKSRGLHFATGLNVKDQKFKYRTAAETNRLHTQSTKPKKDFAAAVGKDPQVQSVLRAHGVKQNQIDSMLAGNGAPKGWQVHHKRPLKWGGDNTPANFVLIKNDPHHIGFTSEQVALQNQLERLGLQEGDTFEVTWPVFPDRVYPL